MKKYLMCVLLIVASGCVEVSDVEKMQPVMTQKNNVDFQYEVIDRDIANQYSVRFQMPESNYLLKKTLLPVENNATQEFEISGHEWTDSTETLSGHTYQYEIGHYEQSKNQNLRFNSNLNLKSEKWITDYKQIIEIPFDLVVEENSEFYVDTDEKARLLRKVNKFVMRQNSYLYTMGRNLEINVRHLQSKNAYIESFPADSTAAYLKPGLSGGDLKLTVDHAEFDSDLFVTMRGQKGGPGLNTNYSHPIIACEEGTSGGQGSVGGDSGNFYYSTPNELRLTPKLEKGEGGEGGYGGEGRTCNKDGSAQIVSFGPRGPRGPIGNPGKICRITKNKEYCRSTN